MFKPKNNTTALTATIYKTELQLFPKKCRVKQQKHSNNTAGLSRNNHKNRQALQSLSEQEFFYNLKVCKKVRTLN
jgi:hypothetical protein